MGLGSEIGVKNGIEDGAGLGTKRDWGGSRIGDEMGLGRERDWGQCRIRDRVVLGTVWDWLSGPWPHLLCCTWLQQIPPGAAAETGMLHKPHLDVAARDLMG